MPPIAWPTWTPADNAALLPIGSRTSSATKDDNQGRLNLTSLALTRPLIEEREITCCPSPPWHSKAQQQAQGFESERAHGPEGERPPPPVGPPGLAAEEAAGSCLVPLARRMEPAVTFEALCSAARSGDLPTLRRLLAADPGLAAVADAEVSQTAPVRCSIRRQGGFSAPAARGGAGGSTDAEYEWAAAAAHSS